MSKREADEVIGDAEKKTFVEEAAADNGSHAMNEDAKTADVAAETALANRATLYHKPHYSSAPNTVVIHELGIKDKVNVVACKGDEHKTGDLAAHNPHGFIPIFKTEEGDHIIECGAISLFLVEKYGGAQVSILGTPEQRAKLLQWLFYGPATLYPMVAPAYNPEVSGNPEKMEELKKKVHEKAFVMISNALGESSPYLLGEQFTLADVHVGYMLVGAKHLGWVDAAAHPKIAAYVDRLMERPSFQAAYA